MIKFYKDSILGVFVLGEESTSFTNPGQFYSETHGDYLAIYNAFTGEKRCDSPYSEYEDENGDPYASLSDLITATYEFFSVRVNSGGFVSSEYSIYVNPSDGLKIRTGVRNGEFVIDKELSPDGFNGTEGVT